MKKWYLSTPMNGKTEKEIKAALQRGIDWVKERGEMNIILLIIQTTKRSMKMGLFLTVCQ